MTGAGTHTPPRRTLEQSLDWVAEGSELLLASVESLADRRLEGPSGLPGWSRTHVIAHVCGNAEALARLAEWAASGIPTPMYGSSDKRAADIAAGAALAPEALRSWAVSSAQALARKLAELTPTAWQSVVTATPGRTLPATDIPWIRAREVLVHAVDLGTGLGFRDLPRDFLIALLDDVVAKRSAGADGPALSLAISDVGEHRLILGTGEMRRVSAGLAPMVGWLTGRSAGRVRMASGAPAPALPPWM
ncbi:MAG: maleylpyruvate isomerase family mycothiol-dependent enzyme [Tetrasphaera sp.]